MPAMSESDIAKKGYWVRPEVIEWSEFFLKYQPPIKISEYRTLLYCDIIQ
jgi:hypothetical protein